jgi:hypothetical protein
MNGQNSFRLPRLPVRSVLAAVRTLRVPRRLRMVVAWCSVVAVAAGTCLYFWLGEGGGPADIAFTGAVTLAMGAAIVCIGRRVLVAVVLVPAMLGIVRAVSHAKQQASEVVLHAYDLVALLRSWSTLVEVCSRHRGLALGLAVVVLAATALSWIAARFDATRVPRLGAACALVLLGSAAWLADSARGPRRHTEFYFENAYVTFFYASWVETVEALWRGSLIEAAGPLRPAQPQRPKAPARCSPAESPPHIILIHQESVVPPALFPTLTYDRSLDALFRSFDGSLNKLRVETFGGASWLTEFSLLTGLSSQSFGGMQPFVQHMMAGGTRDALPLELVRCGYRTVMFSPMLRHFLGADRFFRATGIREVFDAKDQKAEQPNERDRFYYANALAEIGRHVRSSVRPLFLYIQTMAAHGPYDYAYSPEVIVPGGGPGTPPEMSEYLRRLAMVRMDYDHLRAELVRRFPGQKFLILHYGDHQPTATRSLLGFDARASIEEIVASGSEAARTSYYAVDAVRYRPPPLASLDSLDVAYLGTILLEAAGLPLSDSYRERKRLMLLCGGRYHDCQARDEVLRFHRRLIESGLMKAL